MEILDALSTKDLLTIGALTAAIIAIAGIVMLPSGKFILRLTVRQRLSFLLLSLTLSAVVFYPYTVFAERGRWHQKIANSLENEPVTLSKLGGSSCSVVVSRQSGGGNHPISDVADVQEVYAREYGELGHKPEHIPEFDWHFNSRVNDFSAKDDPHDGTGEWFYANAPLPGGFTNSFLGLADACSRSGFAIAQDLTTEP